MCLFQLCLCSSPGLESYDGSCRLINAVRKAFALSVHVDSLSHILLVLRFAGGGKCLETGMTDGRLRRFRPSGTDVMRQRLPPPPRALSRSAHWWLIKQSRCSLISIAAPPEHLGVSGGSVCAQ
jgi:hypothetical protein